MKIFLCETFSSSRKEYVTLPENFDIELEFIKEEGYQYLKVSFHNESDECVFTLAISAPLEYEEVIESIAKYSEHNAVLDSMLAMITTDFQVSLTSSVGNVVVFDIDKYVDRWGELLEEELEDYKKKHFK